MLCDAPGTYLKYFFQPYMYIVATETMETLDNVQKVIIIPLKKKKESFKDNSDHSVYLSDCSAKYKEHYQMLKIGPWRHTTQALLV